MKAFSAPAALPATLLMLAAGLSIAQDASPSVIRWKYGAPNAVIELRNAVKVEGLKTDDLHVYAALYDIRDTVYNRAWVQIVNLSKAPISFNPQSAVLKDGRVMHAEAPDKAADSIQKVGEAKSQELSSAHCAMKATLGTGSSMACEPTEAQMRMSKEVLATSDSVAQWIRKKALAETTLAPGEEAIGAIVFRKDKRPADYTLSIPVGSQTFEFPVRALNKPPSYD